MRRRVIPVSASARPGEGAGCFAIQGAEMNHPNLSEGERLIVLLLCDLYKSLNLKCPIDPALFGPALGGTEAAPRRQSNQEVAAEVGAILDMWSAIERGYKRLSIDEKREVE